MSILMKGCWDPKSSRNVPIKASCHLMSPASLCTKLTMTQLWLCFPSRALGTSVPESPVPHHLVFGGRAKRCVAQPCLSHKSTESGHHEGCKGRPSSDCSKACFRDGHQWERQTNSEAQMWSSSLDSSPKTHHWKLPGQSSCRANAAATVL